MAGARGSRACDLGRSQAVQHLAIAITGAWESALVSRHSGFGDRPSGSSLVSIAATGCQPGFEPAVPAQVTLGRREGGAPLPLHAARFPPRRPFHVDPQISHLGARLVDDVVAVVAVVDVEPSACHRGAELALSTAWPGSPPIRHPHFTGILRRQVPSGTHGGQRPGCAAGPYRHEGQVTPSSQRIDSGHGAVLL